MLRMRMTRACFKWAVTSAVYPPKTGSSAINTVDEGEF